MTTSKVKTIQGDIKPHTNDYGTTYYHNLEMENGDKINIGKKKEVQLGWELTYEITEIGQQEYQKAKSVQKEEFKPQAAKSDSVQKYIVRQSSLNRAIEHLSYKDHDLMTKENVVALAEFYTNWVLEN